MEGSDAGSGAIGKSRDRAVADLSPILRRRRTHRGAFEQFLARGRGHHPRSDDAMMRRVRITLAAPGKRIDARFKRIERRSDARFDAVDAAGRSRRDRTIESLGEKPDRIAAMLEDEFRCRQKTLERA
jgi:hypothetical protein